MSTNATIDTLHAHAGETVTLSGWVSGKRSGGKIVFLQVRDGTGLCQCIVEAGVEEAFATASQLERESSVYVTGEVREDARSVGGYEIAVSVLTCIQAAHDYPITPKPHGVDFLMSHRHLWLRSSRPAAIMRIRHTLIKAVRNFFDERGFILTDTPILTQGAGEDEQTLFPVAYFEQDAYLAQTGQLYLESACMAHRKVYCFGPTFRAEKSTTRRHLTEFWMVEPEVAFAELVDLLVLAVDFIWACVEAVLEHNSAELEALGRDLAPLQKIQKPFVRMTYDDVVDSLRSDEMRQWVEQQLVEATQARDAALKEMAQLESELTQARKAWKQDKLQAKMATLRETLVELERDVENLPKHLKLAQSFEWGKDLGGSDETLIARRSERPVFVTHYPAEAKAFYMKRSPDNPKVVLNMDLLAPEGYGEIIGGSQREDDLDTLESAIVAKGLQPEDYSWYLDLRRYGSVPHGGFGLGIERTLTWICGLKHVRETIAFPRTMGRMYP
ncbi:MAG: asparagine--tRNA ligase [Kiritimatiellae bacterium]|nr:asparagine--tRNA ligase [Kiritimatiellia bacterium]